MIYVGLTVNFQNRVLSAKERQRFNERMATVETEETIVQATSIVREREAVIARGLEGLVVFHESGIDSQDVRTIINIAQTIGIFAIANEV